MSLTGTLRHAFFVKFDFGSGPYYVWQGYRPIRIGGIRWEPVGPNATVQQVEDAVSDNVPSITLSVSGVDASLLSLALSETDEIRLRLAYIFDQYFDENWQPTGSMASYAVIRMDTLKITNTANQDGSRDQVIAITGEHFLTNGPCPPAGRYSSADQWTRMGNNSDLYFEYMAINQNRRQRWPTY